MTLITLNLRLQNEKKKNESQKMKNLLQNADIFIQSCSLPERMVTIYFIISIILYDLWTQNINGPVGWGCRINWLHLCRGVTLPGTNECPGYDIKPSDSEAPASEIRGMWSTPSLPLLPGPLWSRVVAPDRVLSMSQIE